jgi:hypothetical protein
VISFGATKTELRKTVIWAAKLDRPEPGEVDSSLGLHPQRFSVSHGREGKRYCIGRSIVSQRLPSLEAFKWPLWVDAVEKVDNRTTPKNSQILIL